MLVLPLEDELEDYLKRRNLIRKYEKQRKLLEQDNSHPSLNVELLEPAYLRFYSFRIDKKYRAIFIFVSSAVIEVVDINNHYQ